MHSPLRQQLLDLSLAIISQARAPVAAVARRDRDLGSQLRRALSSVALNLAEGLGSAAGNARLRFESARGSLYEAQTALRVAVAWGYLALRRRRQDGGGVRPSVCCGCRFQRRIRP
jgi:four helix bundle protein